MKQNILVTEGDVVRIKYKQKELYILIKDGEMSVSNESDSPPTVVQVNDDGSFALLEGVIE